MRKHILALAAMVLLAGVVSAAPKKGYKITVQIKNAKDTVLYMGYYYGMAKYHFNYGRADQGRMYLRYSMVVPVLLHGFYDFCASSANEISILAFYAYIIVLDVLAIRQIRKFEREDAPL